MRLFKGLAGLVVALSLFILVPMPGAVGHAQVTVKNYFSSTTAGGDNVLHIGGTESVDSGGAVDVKSGATFKIAGVDKTAVVANSPQTFTGGVAAAGKKVAYGQATTASASDTVVTGLAIVVACVASLDSSPAVDPETATCSVGDQAGSPAAGSVLIQTWKTFGGTPAAATTFSKKANFVAWGS